METPATHNHADPDVDCAICMDQERRRGANRPPGDGGVAAGRVIARRGRGAAEGAALTFIGRSAIRAGFALPRDAGRRPALQPSEPPHLLGLRAETGAIPRVGVLAAAALRAAVPTGGRRSLACWAISPSGVRVETGVILTVGVSAAAALRAAVPVGDRRSSRPRACSPSAVRGTHAGRTERHRGGFRAPARCRSETGAPGVPALVLGLRCAALRLAGWSVIGACFALPRDAGRRPALQPSPRLFSVCGTRHPPWRDGASSARVSRSRAMPVGDRRSWRFPACSATSEAGGPSRRPLGEDVRRV